MFQSGMLLTDRLKQHNSNSGSEIQAAGSMHWNANAAIVIGRKQTLGEAFRLRTKYQKIIAVKSHIVVRALTFCR